MYMISDKVADIRETLMIPSAYQAGYDKASVLDPTLAARYIEHTVIGDPLADAAVESMAEFRQDKVHQFIKAGMEQNAALFTRAPQALRDLFEHLEEVPPWFDSESERIKAGCRAFHYDSDLFLLAFVTDVILRGFATLISKSFFMSGRIWSHGVRRLQRNVLHLTEIMVPRGLQRHGEGWMLSVRIRLVHAQIRRLLLLSDEWDADIDGTPLSAAHIGLASANFSAQLLKSATLLGAAPNDAGRDGFMQIWRYSAYLMGVPETILFRGEVDAQELHRIGCLCEPPPDIEAIAMSHALINSAPTVANITNPAKRRVAVQFAYRLSRTLLGDELADQLQFPAQRTGTFLGWLRWKRRVDNALGRLFPHRWGRTRRFMSLTGIIAPESYAISFQLPDRMSSDLSKEW